LIRRKLCLVAPLHAGADTAYRQSSESAAAEHTQILYHHNRRGRASSCCNARRVRSLHGTWIVRCSDAWFREKMPATSVAGIFVGRSQVVFA
jgi:hypothetical protein